MTKRTLTLLIIMWVLAIFAPLARCADWQFTHEVTRRAKQFGYDGDSHSSYYVSLVDLPFFQVRIKDMAFAASIWDDEAPEFRVWVLSDKGLDQLADLQKLPHLSRRDKHALQRAAIVHEFVHGWGIDSERITVAMTSFITGHNAGHVATPKRWYVILKKRAAEEALKAEAEKEKNVESSR